MLKSLTHHWSPISKNESTLLKALAILAIVFHNYLHHVETLPGENEFNFSADRCVALIDGLASTPWDFFRLLATYFGHYGVQVFFFLSGYGLALKYHNSQPQWWTFQKSRWKKLYPAIIAAALGYLLYNGIRYDFWYILETEGFYLLRQMLGISNFIPDNVYHPIGPWWFIGVILQFYLLAPFILRWTNRHGDKVLYILMGFSILAELALDPLLYKLFDFNINHSIIGHLDVCALGIWFARKKNFTIPPVIMISAGILFLLGNYFFLIWLTTGISVIFLLIPLMRYMTKHITRINILNAALMFTGQLSMYMFLCNGYLRQPLLKTPQASHHWWTSVWTSMLFLAIVYAWSLMLRAGVTYTSRLCKKS